ncbi:helix-turn-helix domain-containing protein [Aphanothece sacrum]|uniref:Helix-turn-helix domain protein n=1 Tax=Aphanothece sacrum FPU1 TaxID=1920663 RepID=A0A401IFR5_APHSA|nr:transcriptional regulator [Aphanothece sacrum]GBF80137.1 helix-turn-helix domain protein [Aphanothece sacrum FPU1]GBF86384.1 Helix-turn-helix domain protein [Aphanothece sacrum FPU3]
MNLRPIKTDNDYQQALQEIESLFDAELNTPSGEKLEILATLVEVYEQEHYPIELPTPIEAILYHLESRHQGVSLFIEGLKRRGVSDEIINEALTDLVKII